MEPASSINRLQAYLRHGAQQQSQTWYRWAMEYHALHKDGVELTLELRSEAHVELRVVDHSDGLPEACGIDEARPPDTMPEDDLPATTRFADATFVGRSFDLTGRTEVRLSAWRLADDRRYGPLRVASVREAVERRRWGMSAELKGTGGD